MVYNNLDATNRTFPSSPGRLFQNEGGCSAFDTEIIFHSHTNKTRFHKKGCAPSLILKVRIFGTRKWPIILVLFWGGAFGHIPLQGNHAFTPYVWSVWTAATPVLYSVVSFFGNVNHMFSAVHTAVQYTELLSAYHSPKHFSSYLRGKTEFL